VRAAAILTTVALSIASGCGGDDRPSDADWAVTWERERALVPTVDELLDGGRRLCDDLVGEYRESMPRLTPTPSDTLDDAVQEWVEEAESLVFECPDDTVEIEARLADLDVLATEIDAGLAADTG
jgi:hypothetical protein